MNPKIIYTITDEAPGLATSSLLPIIRTFTKTAGVDVETRDISLAARILAAFPESLPGGQKVPDDLAELGELVKNPQANIIKLPNISASLPQLMAAVNELKDKGFRLPDYPENPENDRDRDIKNRYDRVKGSAVNPVLREGNSDRRAPAAVKNYAKKHPHSMGEWSRDSRTRVACMSQGDFYGTEKSVLLPAPAAVKVELTGESGKVTLLKEKISLLEGEILDSAVMRIGELSKFLKEQMAKALEENLLFSLHLKCTMMKISDPIIFGQAVSLYLEEWFTRYEDVLKTLEAKPDQGLADILARVNTLPEAKKTELLRAVEESSARQPKLAMVDSKKGITNLHVPSDVIIDASMPAAIRSSGKMWAPDGSLQDTLAVIPDRAYAGIYQETIDFCRQQGALDPRAMGSVSNVGLMAQQAEEYGSHDKTFKIADAGTVRVVNDSGKILMEQKVQAGDIFRMCQLKDAPVRDWVRLAVKRARATGEPAVFWLDPNRSHDALVIEKVKEYLPLQDTRGLDIRILDPRAATRFSLERIKEGKNTISVTGNVLRDYLTDLFPILELGTSAKMLSIVSLMNGGGLFETGAGGSAPKHVQQFLKEGHLRWDSLGEFLALTVSLEHLGESLKNKKAQILSKTLDKATEDFLENNKSPSRKVHELDNRGSHFYLALYWARALADQTEDLELKGIFSPLAEKLAQAEDTIIEELDAAQGKPWDLKGYYRPDPPALEKAMRPSTTFNRILLGIMQNGARNN